MDIIKSLLDCLYNNGKAIVSPPLLYEYHYTLIEITDNIFFVYDETTLFNP